VRALGPVALRRHDAALVALARGVSQLALRARADERRARLVGPRGRQPAVRELPVAEARADRISSVALGDARAAIAAKGVVEVLSAAQQRVVGLLRDCLGPVRSGFGPMKTRTGPGTGHQIPGPGPVRSG
jgi:hypothetical protein